MHTFIHFTFFYFTLTNIHCVYKSVVPLELGVLSPYNYSLSGFMSFTSIPNIRAILVPELKFVLLY